jgi:3,4-dihydroxy-9,10-secoandrosta-1,3,5(10)-triene-9,17-dione 4,5-dioxygenase
MNILGLGYLVLETERVDAWVDFATEVLGMMPAGTGEDGDVLLRMDERPYRLRIRQGDHEGPAAIGWEVPTRRDFEDAVEELGKAGFAVDVDDDLAHARRVAGVLGVELPGSWRHEIFYQPDIDYTPFVSPQGVSGFVTGELGMGHLVIRVADIEAATDVYTGVMGFRITDVMTLGGRPVRFMHCRTRHHCLAIGEGEEPFIHHFMVQVPSLDDVGYALDRALDHGATITESLGKHTNDQMVSFYVQTPSGFGVEYGYGARLVDDATWTTSHTTRGSLWGHRRAGS